MTTIRFKPTMGATLQRRLQQHQRWRQPAAI